jgi:hypothetical protein
MVSIRIGTRADLADVTALEAGQDTAAWLGKTGLDWHERALADPGQEHLIAEDDGRLAGRCIRQNMESSADGVGTVLNGTYRDLLSAIAECGATLTGLLFVGVARAWELVGDRDTRILASIAVLTGHDPNSDS